MGVTVGPVGDDRAAEYLAAMGQAFGFDSSDEHRERFSKYFEWDRARAAYDGDRIVGTLGAYSFEMTVPGGTMPCGGTTVVAVLPTHRRRGVLRQMIESHFEDVRERGEPIAGLWASESSIYGRFGYGIAAVGLDVEVDRDHVDLHRLAPRAAPARLVSREEAMDLFPPFYDRERRLRPGFFARSPSWWEFRRFHDSEPSREGATAFRYAVTEENGVVTGFAQYRFKEKWREGHGQEPFSSTNCSGAPRVVGRIVVAGAQPRPDSSIRRQPQRRRSLFGLLAAAACTTVDDSRGSRSSTFDGHWRAVRTRPLCRQWSGSTIRRTQPRRRGGSICRPTAPR